VTNAQCLSSLPSKSQALSSRRDRPAFQSWKAKLPLPLHFAVHCIKMMSFAKQPPLTRDGRWVFGALWMHARKSNRSRLRGRPGNDRAAFQSSQSRKIQDPRTRSEEVNSMCATRPSLPAIQRVCGRARIVEAQHKGELVARGHPKKEEAARQGGLGESDSVGGDRSNSRITIGDISTEVNPLRLKHVDACLVRFRETGDASWLRAAREIYVNAARASWPQWLAQWLGNKLKGPSK
jgi:hypothetical protein